ncbi:MAG: substrate-binding domain-containing protein [Alphaproteobacteria bacterium]
MQPRKKYKKQNSRQTSCLRLTQLYLSIAATVTATVLAIPATAQSQDPILVQSTTSTENSGLYDFILPKFQNQTGWRVKVVSVGSGQALRNAQDGNADLVIVHDPQAEEKFIAQGYGLNRKPFMYNHYVLVGPANDPASIQNATSPTHALKQIATIQAPFISRGDHSGTHQKEIQLWKNHPRQQNWYREAGSGMGATLNLAANLNAYTLTDRATWAAFANKQNLQSLFPKNKTPQTKNTPDPDNELFNQYSLIQVNPVRHPHVNAKGAAALAKWLLSPQGQTVINAFRVHNQQVFFANANTPQ